MTAPRILDVVVQGIAAEASDRRRTSVLRRDDHLLRRFGAAEVLRVSGDAPFATWRRTADEIWVGLEGEAEVRLDDRRPDSPTSGAQETVHLDPSTRVLVPFGVRAVLRTSGTTAVVLRLMTHDLDDEPEISEAVRATRA